MDILKIKNWNAKRAGGRITITGVDVETSLVVKIVGVDTIESRVNGSPVATDKDGKRYILTNFA